MVHFVCLSQKYLNTALSLSSETKGRSRMGKGAPGKLPLTKQFHHWIQMLVSDWALIGPFIPTRLIWPWVSFFSRFMFIPFKSLLNKGMVEGLQYWFFTYIFHIELFLYKTANFGTGTGSVLLRVISVLLTVKKAKDPPCRCLLYQGVKSHYGSWRCPFH